MNRQERVDLAVRALLGSVAAFSRVGIRTHPLRRYQLEAVEPVIESVLRRRGLEFAWVFARQSGKDEAKAQLAAYLLTLHQRAGGQVVEANPTFKPQCLTAKQRLLDRLQSCPLTAGRTVREILDGTGF